MSLYVWVIGFLVICMTISSSVKELSEMKPTIYCYKITHGGYTLFLLLRRKPLLYLNYPSTERVLL